MRHSYFTTITATALTTALLAATPTFAAELEIEQLRNSQLPGLVGLDISTANLTQATLNDLVKIKAALDRGNSEAKLRINRTLGNDVPDM